MLEAVREQLKKQNICSADLKDSFFVGDAAGRVGDFAASDK